MDKAQSNLMEYLLMTFFLLVIIVALVFFITGFEFVRLDVRQQDKTAGRALFLTRQLLVSPYLATEDSLFDDRRLTAAASVACSELEAVYGFRWFAQVRTVGEDPVLCDAGNFPDCNAWDFCVQGGRNVSFIVPVNIYRSAPQLVDLGTLKVGVYP